MQVNKTLNEELKIPEDMKNTWQTIVDLMAKSFNVPSAIITRVIPPLIEVFKSSKGERNPYIEGHQVEMANHYCERVIKSGSILHVKYAPEEPDWANAPEIDYNMMSYLGYPLRWPSGDIFGTICVLDNKKNEYSDTFRQMMDKFRSIVEYHLHHIYEADQLQKLNHTKDKLLSVISHDLVGPIGSSLNLANELHKNFESFDKNEIQQAIKSFYTSTNWSYHLLLNLLHWARLQSNRISPNFRETVLYDIIQHNLDNFTVRIAEKNITVINNIPANLTAYSDPLLVNSIFQNIISNAIKFSPKNRGIFINSSQTDNIIKIDITDEGVGMSEMNLEKINKLGALQSTEGTSGESGSGLGIYIIKEFVKLVEGRLNVTSKVGEGTTFSVELIKL